MKDIVRQDADIIAAKIFSLRGKKVLLDRDLAPLYAVTTGNLNKAVKRNLDRFPEDFMFQITKEEADSLKFQFGSLKRGQHSKYLPYAFTEQGVSMLSAVLNSPIAVDISIRIMRAFVKLRSILAENEALRYAIEGLERRVGKNERDIQLAIKAIQSILTPPEPTKPKIRIGFTPPEKK
ncbi:MAG: ORF6N domain-containing protein [Chitinispirillaceae bacterium]|nr:ORF6N domain-containing protein [Chitinispirillaceae bacterium]